MAKHPIFSKRFLSHKRNVQNRFQMAKKCLKKFVYTHLKKDLRPLVNFNNGIFLDVIYSLLNETTRFFNTFENTKTRELQKYTHGDTVL